MARGQGEGDEEEVVVEEVRVWLSVLRSQWEPGGCFVLGGERGAGMSLYSDTWAQGGPVFCF